MPIFNHCCCVWNCCGKGETNFSYNAYFLPKKNITRLPCNLPRATQRDWFGLTAAVQRSSTQ